LEVRDAPYDEGGAINLIWDKMPYDQPGVEYVVLASSSPTGPFEEITRFLAQTRYKADYPFPFWAWEKTTQKHCVTIDKCFEWDEEKKKKVKKSLANGKTYYFQLVVKAGEEEVRSKIVRGVPQGNWFNLVKLNSFIFMLLFSAVILWFISRAKKKQLFLRKIPGLEAVEEAIGRATEMGRPIYYLTGRLGMSSVPTIAATVILGEIAQKIALYETELKVPHTDPIVMVVCQEIVKEAYLKAGRPDAYREGSNFFITEDQFSYTAAVDGMMMREKPAACFYMGYYYAESLLLAETGASVGAIQIAGTDAEHQLPFFITACDYTLIGEELYAASAYLSREPVLIGTLRGQDLGKTLIMGLILLGGILSTFVSFFNWSGGIKNFLDLFKMF
jgi:hypothetical protein